MARSDENETHVYCTWNELGLTVRALPSNRFVKDAFYSGLASRELPLIERLIIGLLSQPPHA